MSVKSDFPLFANNPGLVYLDYANTAPKPQVVIDAVTEYYTHYSGNVHRANHNVGSRADEAYEKSRLKIARFLSVEHDQVVFLKNTTEGINLVANSFAGKHFRAEDRILATGLEHHANLVSWQLLSNRIGTESVFSSVDKDGNFDEADWMSKLDSGIKLATFTAVSNVTGERLPIERMVESAKAVGAATLIDAAQLLPHERIDFTSIGADFMVFSGHKLYGPTGIGILVGRRDMLASMDPWIGGGDMIDTVTYDQSTFQDPPLRFEAGTPPIASVIGLGAAVDYLDTRLNADHKDLESAQMDRLLSGLNSIDGLRMLGHPDRSSRLVSFTIEGIHSADLAAYLNERDVAVRVGKMCAHPLLAQSGVDSVIRASIGLPTDGNDIDSFLSAIHRGTEILR
jgi:SufS family cysteine desulfurase